MTDSWERLEADILGCRACPRLVQHRERVARQRRAAYRDQVYWGRPVPGFGDRFARVVLVGLAPGAHGSNRTGRMFTGDRSGDWLYRALHEAGFASQASSTSRDDGMQLRDAFITAVNRCVPPANRPTPEEREACRPLLERELELIDATGPGIRVLVALGQFAYDQLLRVLRARGCPVPRPKPRFAHGLQVPIGRATAGFPRARVSLIGCYHPSQQNTFTGKLTDRMLAGILEQARGALVTGH